MHQYTIYNIIYHYIIYHALIYKLYNIKYHYIIYHAPIYKLTYTWMRKYIRKCKRNT